MRVFVSVLTEDVHVLSVEVVDNRLMRAKLITVLADRLPSIEVAVPCGFKVFQIGGIRVILVRRLDFFLVYP